MILMLFLMVERLIKTLDGSPLKTHPSCFFLSWPDHVAQWIPISQLDKSSVQFSCYVKWKELRGEVLVATDYQGKNFTIELDNPYTNKDYLKSHLQKVIRRSNTYKALKTAVHFIDLDLPGFLRRLSIIALEDALPIEGYSTIIWFMSAVSKGYILSMEQICWCLGYVYDLCQCSHYEQVDTEIEPKIKDMRLYSLSDEGKNLVYSILFRQCYGGLKGDKSLCRVASCIWAGRYHCKSRFLPLLQRDEKFITFPTEVLFRQEWVIAAIDFHCCPNIIYSLLEKHDEYSEDDIRSAIWHCNSSLTNKKLIGSDMNKRTPRNEKLILIWKDIKKDCLSYARFMLEKQG